MARESGIHAPDYFISYSHRDTPVAEALTAGLSDHGLQTFIDSQGVGADDRWDQVVQNALQRCKAILVLLSPESVLSENVLDEVSYALDSHKHMVPVLLRPCEVPLRLRRFECLDIQRLGEDNLLQHLVRLVEKGSPRHGLTVSDDRWERPSIVVLPFTDLSQRDESAALCDGLLHDIIGNLSLNKEFFVIASGTSLTYKNHAHSLLTIANELGVRYAVTGSLRQDGKQVLVSVELCNAQNERVIWTSKFQHDLVDLIELQEEISRAVAVAVQPSLTRAEIKRVVRQPVDNLSAWELFQRARTYNWSYDWLKKSITILERAVALDQTSAHAHALLSARLAYLLWYGEFDRLTDAFNHLRIALELQPNDPFVQVASAIVNMQTGNPQRAIRAAEAALDINPNLAEAWAYCGACNGIVGNSENGLRQLSMAFRLSPKDPLRYIWHLFEMVCLVAKEDYAAAIAAGDASIALNGEWFFVYMSQAVNFAVTGDCARAKALWQQAIALNPQVSVPAYKMWLGQSNLSAQHQQRLFDALARCGCE